MNKKEKINKFWESRVLKYKRNFEDYAAASKKTLNKPMNKEILKEFDEKFEIVYGGVRLKIVDGDDYKKIRRWIGRKLQQKDQALIEKIEKKIKEPEENQTQYSFGKDVGKIQAYKDIINLIKEG